MDFATGRLIFFSALLYYILVITHTVIFNTLFLTGRDCYG